MRRLLARSMWAAALAAVIAGSARAEVTVVEDEVVFALNDAKAASVFLVGDFNNWNPTMEKMQKTDGRFEVRLYLLPGRYRYKFVVDGTWIADPDNPGADPAKGSPLELQERAGMLVLGAAQESENHRAEKLRPSVRYVGAFFAENDGTRSDQVLDFWLKRTGKSVAAEVNFNTLEQSWHASPPSADVLFNRGHLDIAWGDGVVKGFENDSTWASADPLHLFGDVGVYGYDAGFARRGVSIKAPPLFNTTLRAVFSDYVGERPSAPPTIESQALETFAASAAPDTVFYRYENGYEDADTWGFDFAGDAGSVGFGYARRWNRGFHQGSLADVEKRGASFDVSFFATREFWDADSWWARWGFWDGLGATLGFGRSSAEVRTNAESATVIEGVRDLRIGQATEPSDRAIPFQTSRRWLGAVDYARGAWRANAAYSLDKYEFDGALYRHSEARIEDSAADLLYAAKKWSASGSFRYLDQDYGSTPPDFHALTPRRNFWLDYRDKLAVEDMVSFDLEKSAEIRGRFEWGKRTLSEIGAARKPGDTAVLAEAGATARGFFDAFEYSFFRVGLEYALPRGFYLQLDSRTARYDKKSWRVSKSFFAVYAECGYRNRWAEASVGFGLDPVVLDPVVNEYADIGRSEYLRRAIPSDLTRNDSAALGENLRRREEGLEDVRAVKLEVILLF
jgi:hypothetical protein